MEYLEGARRDGPGVKRRLHFTGVPAWDEQATRWREDESIVWQGIRNPAQRHWSQQLELIPGRTIDPARPGEPAIYTTLRWDVFFSLAAPNVAKRAFKATLEDILVSALARIDRQATGPGGTAAGSPPNP